MSSFVANGHTVRLHVYQPPEGVPAGVQLADAAKTLPRKRMFRMKESNSVAGFADWFRFQLLHDQGGIWADTDVVCLKPLI
ncbi:MAG TPA: glycosyltransferase, partial [Steroidobacteraceae bacterium]|nr:glycosyltransferase [Steroidobacteraceae bacterium]